MTLNSNLKFFYKLKEKFESLSLHRPFKKNKYINGETLIYQAHDLETNNLLTITLQIINFVGGGFAGQVYKVKIIDIKGKIKPNQVIKINHYYALKIMVPATGFALFFRNLIYRIGFLAPFQLQVNLDAAKAGALWQKFIRRGAQIYFKRANVVNNIHLVFVDKNLGSCGEISDWVEGRTWKLEADAHIDLLKKGFKENIAPDKKQGSFEYREKKRFMKDFVQLLYDMGAYEFARQYEWSTCKSQPNCLKLLDNKSQGDLIAVDFRAGLALLPFLPMSPGDFKLILKGLFRGSPVQFDRGNLKKLEDFINHHQEFFKDLKPLFAELKRSAKIYQNSIPDLTHNFFKFFYSKKFYQTLFLKTVEGWKIKNLIDNKTQDRLKKSKILTLIFYILGIIPFLGTFFRKIWGRKDYKQHYKNLIISPEYLKKSLKGKSIEKSRQWYQNEYISQKKAERISSSVFLFLCHIPFSILPKGIFKFITDFGYFKERLFYIFIRPFKLYFNQELRTEWLKEMIGEGIKKRMLGDREANKIKSQLKEPFIQKYLKSLAVHICTLPVTQIVSIAVSYIYVKLNPQLSVVEATAAVAGILILFQITPVSPGSLVRGFYVIGLMVRDRNFKDYKIAVFLSFFKYIGYLAFPIQMTYRYPELSRFMAGHWATEAAHIIPVFGERGALLEHFAFRLFYNWPLTIRRRMRETGKLRQTQKSRYIHLPILILQSIMTLVIFDYLFFRRMLYISSIKDMWGLGILLSIVFGFFISMGCKGNSIPNRISQAVLWGFVGGILSKVTLLLFNFNILFKDLLVDTAWRVFLLIIFAVIGLTVRELFIKNPN